MNEVKISDQLYNLLKKCRLGILSANVKVQPSSTEYLKKIDRFHEDLMVSLGSKNEKEFDVISETRTAYKLCGKEPSRYRPSAEALLRRLRTKRSLYQINNVVDTINLISMTSKFSIGGFNANQIKGDIICDIGDAKPYIAIGRGQLNIECMPGVKDDLGFFGTPTSDSERTMVTNDTTNLLLVYYDFFGNDSLNEALEFGRTFIRENCSGENISISIAPQN